MPLTGLVGYKKISGRPNIGGGSVLPKDSDPGPLSGLTVNIQFPAKAFA